MQERSLAITRALRMFVFGYKVRRVSACTGQVCASRNASINTAQIQGGYGVLHFDVGIADFERGLVVCSLASLTFPASTTNTTNITNTFSW